MSTSSNWGIYEDYDISFAYPTMSKYICRVHMNRIFQSLRLIDFALSREGIRKSNIEECLFLINDETDKYFIETGRVKIFINKDLFISDEFETVTKPLVEFDRVENIQDLMDTSDTYCYRNIRDGRYVIKRKGSKETISFDI